MIKSEIIINRGGDYYLWKENNFWECGWHNMPMILNIHFMIQIRYILGPLWGSVTSICVASKHFLHQCMHCQGSVVSSHSLSSVAMVASTLSCEHKSTMFVTFYVWKIANKQVQLQWRNLSKPSVIMELAHIFYKTNQH